MKKNTLKVLSALFLSLFLVTACSKDKKAEAKLKLDSEIAK
jgi:hypothetical protein